MLMTSGAERAESPKEEKLAFPEIVDEVKARWYDAVMQQPDDHKDYDDVARVVAGRLNSDAGFRVQRQHAGLSEEITPEEVLSTRENFFKA